MSVSSQEQAVLTLVQEAVGKILFTSDRAEISTSPDPTPWGRGRLTVVPSPAGVADKESFLRSPELAFWLDKQRVTYDYTFLNAPPILRHADGTLASLFCDGVVLVARAGVTRGEALGRAREQVERVGEECSAWC